MGKVRLQQPVDLFDYRFRSHPLPPTVRPPKAVPAYPGIRVTDDWPDVVPITEAELRAVEGHLGDVLDKLFGPRQ